MVVGLFSVLQGLVQAPRGGVEVYLVALLIGVLLLSAAVFAPRLLLKLVRWDRPVEFLDDPIPSHWMAIVERNFSLARRLNEEDRIRLLRLAQLFIHKKHFEGTHGLEVTEEMKVTIAAQACYLILFNGLSVYPSLRTIVIYPEAFRTEDEGHPDLATHGLSWSGGVVVLAWDGVLKGGVIPNDGHNLTLHEFAHQLDQQSGATDGIPGALNPTRINPWAKLLEKRLGVLRRASWEGRRTVLDYYGATNEAEFFAVATETFFELPGPMKGKEPELYDLLTGFYGVDPLE